MAEPERICLLMDHERPRNQLPLHFFLCEIINFPIVNITGFLLLPAKWTITDKTVQGDLEPWSIQLLKSLFSARTYNNIDFNYSIKDESCMRQLS